MNVLETISQAIKYAEMLAARNNCTILVFPVNEGTGAYAYGYRFGTCYVEEREEYESRGAKIVAEVKP